MSVWERDPRFGDVVTEAWNATGRASTVADLSHKLASVAGPLQRWGRTTFGAVRAELRARRTQLQDLRAMPSRVSPSDEEKGLKPG